MPGRADAGGVRRVSARVPGSAPGVARRHLPGRWDAAAGGGGGWAGDRFVAACRPFVRALRRGQSGSERRAGGSVPVRRLIVYSRSGIYGVMTETLSSENGRTVLRMR